MRLKVLTLGVVLAIGCGDNGGETAGSSGSSTSASESTSGSTSPGTSSGGLPTSSGVESSSGGSSTGEVTTGSESGSSEGSGTTGNELDCEALSDVPLVPVKVFTGFDGSEDLAFDGQGALALKRDGNVVLVRDDLSETTLAGVPPAYGTRFMADGRLLVALPQAGKVIAVDPQGQISDFLLNVQGPNGIFPDLAGDVWITEFGGDRVLRVGAGPDPKVIVEGADAGSANGVVYDPQRSLLFYTNYQSGQIRRVAIDGQGEPSAPELVTEIAGASPDGLTLDACGYLYVVDQGNSTLYRVLLDAAGEATAEASELVVFPSNVANAQFGVGEGFDAHRLYVAGNPGDVYAVTLEFPGAPIVTVQ